MFDELFYLYQNFIEVSFDPFGIDMLLMWGSIIFYMLDFYNLVKLRSRYETMAMLAVPLLFSLTVGVLSTILVHIPDIGNTQRMSYFAYSVLSYRRIYIQLFILFSVYCILWVVTFLTQRQRDKKDRRKWIFSCIPDYFLLAAGFITTLFYIFTGRRLFLNFKGFWFLWIFLYAIFYLTIKILLFSIGIVVRLISIRINFIRYKDEMNPNRFVTLYFVFCHSAIARNILFFESLVLIIISAALFTDEGITPEGVLAIIILLLCGVVCVIFSIKPCIEGIEQFSVWGKPDRINEQFCREYFGDEVVFRNKQFTVTKTFLVDEEQTASVYYWPALIKNRKIHDKNGKCISLTFKDGREFRIPPEDEKKYEPVLQYANRYLDTKQFGRYENNTDCQSNGSEFIKRLAFFIMALFAVTTFFSFFIMQFL